MFSKHRLEALSDGIFAIAMTLLVLDLKVPDGLLPRHFGIMLAQQWISFLITFTIASIFWTMQHRVFALMEGVHQRTLIPTFTFLGFVSVLPFSTSLLGHRLQEPISYMVYYGNVFLMAAALTCKLEMALRLGAVPRSIDTQILRARLYSTCVVMAAGGIGAAALPVRWVFVPPLILGVGAKLWRKRQEARMQTMQA